jgi:N-acetylmuramoyl-L-alanine amidase
MIVRNHCLHLADDAPCDFISSPNLGGRLLPQYLVMHYTAGRSSRESIGWMCDPRAKASAHIVIGRDGSVTQLVSLDRIAWHAGRSAWAGRTGLNRWSIGIEMDNAGRLMERGSGWHHWTGEPSYDHDDVVVAAHKNEDIESGWQRYPAAQLDAALEVARLLVAEYRLSDVIGHDDISPGRKCDPGPAFPMEAFREMVFGPPLAGRPEWE